VVAVTPRREDGRFVKIIDTGSKTGPPTGVARRLAELKKPSMRLYNWLSVDYFALFTDFDVALRIALQSALVSDFRATVNFTPAIDQHERKPSGNELPRFFVLTS
jgi:hypothetical protein